jgi:hypothetical protein
VPLRHNHLADKVKEFIYIAVKASLTHLFPLGIQMHLKVAVNFGATREELMEVLELTISSVPWQKDVLEPKVKDLVRSMIASHHDQISQAQTGTRGHCNTLVQRVRSCVAKQYRSFSRRASACAYQCIAASTSEAPHCFP